jgi:hypothetical protein
VKQRIRPMLGFNQFDNAAVTTSEIVLAEKIKQYKTGKDGTSTGRSSSCVSPGNGLGYFFLSLGVGAAVGLLLAPRSGRETRNYLQTKTREGAEYLKRQGQDLVDGATETIERGKQKLRNQVNNLSDADQGPKRLLIRRPRSARARA